jgi:hypothetical protein
MYWLVLGTVACVIATGIFLGVRVYLTGKWLEYLEETETGDEEE